MCATAIRDYANYRRALRMRYRNHQAYRHAIDRAALMILAALSDHLQPQISSVQLEILQRQCDGVRGQGSANLHAVFADIRKRSASILAAELREARVADDVAAEMNQGA
jgi:hypothetical protein